MLGSVLGGDGGWELSLTDILLPFLLNCFCCISGHFIIIPSMPGNASYVKLYTWTHQLGLLWNCSQSYPELVFQINRTLNVIVVALLVAFNRFSRRVLRRIWKVFAKPVTNALNRIPSRRVHDIVHYVDVERSQRGLIQESVVRAGGLNRCVRCKVLAVRRFKCAGRVEFYCRERKCRQQGQCLVWKSSFIISQAGRYQVYSCLVQGLNLFEFGHGIVFLRVEMLLILSRQPLQPLRK